MDVNKLLADHGTVIASLVLVVWVELRARPYLKAMHDLLVKVADALKVTVTADERDPPMPSAGDVATAVKAALPAVVMATAASNVSPNKPDVRPVT